MRVETAVNTILSEVRTLRSLNDKLAERLAELEDQADADRLRKAYRAGYSAGHTAASAGRGRRENPEDHAQGKLGRLIR